MLSLFRHEISSDVKVTLVADRGFASQRFFSFLNDELGFNYVIRIKTNTTVTSNDGISRPAKDWLTKDGRAIGIKDAKITREGYMVSKVVVVRDKGMKANWILASNLALGSRELINLYAKRWKIEPYFRDLKSGRCGFGLGQSHLKSGKRRDMLLLIVSICYLLLNILGEAGENIGFDRKLKVNTVKTRTHSLFTQGEFYHLMFPRFSTDEQFRLLQEFQS